MQQMTKVSPSGQPERLRRLSRLADSLWLALLGAGVGGIEYAQSKTGRNAHGANPTAPGCPQPQHSLSLSLNLDASGRRAVWEGPGARPSRWTPLSAAAAAAAAVPAWRRWSRRSVGCTPRRTGCSSRWPRSSAGCPLSGQASAARVLEKAGRKYRARMQNALLPSNNPNVTAWPKCFASPSRSAGRPLRAPESPAPTSSPTQTPSTLRSRGGAGSARTLRWVACLQHVATGQVGVNTQLSEERQSAVCSPSPIMACSCSSASFM